MEDSSGNSRAFLPSTLEYNLSKTLKMSLINSTERIVEVEVVEGRTGFCVQRNTKINEYHGLFSFYFSMLFDYMQRVPEGLSGTLKHIKHTQYIKNIGTYIVISSTVM